MKQIEVLGKKVDIAFNVATQIAYEDIVGEPFAIDKLAYTKHSIALYMAAIIANNKGIDITFDDLVNNASAEDIKALQQTVIEEMTNWLKVPDAVKQEDKENEGKNA